MTALHRIRVMLVDDDRAMCKAVASDLEDHGATVEWRTSADEAFEYVRNHEVDAVITDMNMKGMNGLDLCQRIVANRPAVPVIVITAFGSLDGAIATIRAGAFDFITKPFAIDDIVIALERAIQSRALREEVHRLRSAVETASSESEIVGRSPPMVALADLIARTAASDVNVLITGESGTGKELVGRAIHRRGAHPEGPFVAFNCAAIPESLFESELFGHAKGAFTEARAARRGLLVEANGGTLFLDEIGDMPLSTQAKLLRALQERTVRPVGSNVSVPFDARILAATNKNLEAAVADKAFREDLYYRINVVHLEVPPLRSRAGDILLLAQHFLFRAATRLHKPVSGVSTPVAERFLSYGWPGNVRELENCIERAVALTTFSELTVEDLPERLRNYKPSPIVVATSPDELVTLEELERRYIVRVLEEVAGNKSTAARILGLDRTTLYRMLERFGLR